MYALKGLNCHAQGSQLPSDKLQLGVLRRHHNRNLPSLFHTIHTWLVSSRSCSDSGKLMWVQAGTAGWQLRQHAGMHVPDITTQTSTSHSLTPPPPTHANTLLSVGLYRLD